MELSNTHRCVPLHKHTWPRIPDGLPETPVPEPSHTGRLRGAPFEHLLLENTLGQPHLGPMAPFCRIQNAVTARLHAAQIHTLIIRRAEAAEYLRNPLDTHKILEVRTHAILGSKVHTQPLPRHTTAALELLHPRVLKYLLIRDTK